MALPGTVFVGRDRVLDATMSKLAERLMERGVTVVRPSWSAGPGELLAGDIRDAAVVVVSSRTRVGRDLLTGAAGLRGVVFPSIGVESCDLDAASELGIVVANGATPENVDSMAEATTMLIAALRLSLPLKRRQFHHAGTRPPPLAGEMVAGSIVGLVGFGRIAKAVVHRLAGWRVGGILAHTRTPPAAEDWPQVKFVALPTLLAESDVVSLHVPLTDATRDMIGAAELGAMKPGSALINTSRGGLVDEGALVRALEKGDLGGVAIDTFLDEPPSADHPLGRYENVILTRHNVGHTHELFNSLVPTGVDNVTRILQGQLPVHLCNPTVTPHWRARTVR
jgi:phosphoglycerate dehydrogenase-like enzyme